MTSNPLQLLLVKQLYDDACILVAREDDLSLIKSVILLDLSVEQMLNQILRDFHRDFSPTANGGRKDVGWQRLWQHASPELKKMGSELLNYRELSSLHEVRNLAQHNASIPTQAEVKRYVQPADEMMTRIFHDAYKQDFHNFTLWDLIPNEGLRQWLQDSESALSSGQSEISIAGCNVAHGLIISAIRNFTRLRRFGRASVFSGSSFSGFPRGFPSMLSSYLSQMMGAIEFLEDEVVTIGAGMPLMDTRKFQKIGSDVLVFLADSGDIQINTKTSGSERGEVAQGARFMLNYLSRLVRLVDEAYPGVLEGIQVKKRLRGQKIWEAVEPAAEPPSETR
jgi:hypothetical protein